MCFRVHLFLFTVILMLFSAMGAQPEGWLKGKSKFLESKFSSFEKNIHKVFFSDAGDGPISLCGPSAQLSILFNSTHDCQRYLSSPVIASPLGSFWSNCSASSICLSYSDVITFDLNGFNIVVMAGVGITSGSIQFDSLTSCQTALNASLYGGSVKGSCLPSSTLAMFNGYHGDFSTPVRPSMSVTQVSLHRG